MGKNFKEAFELVFWLNFGFDHLHRERFVSRLEEIGISAERFPAFGGSSRTGVMRKLLLEQGGQPEHLGRRAGSGLNWSCDVIRARNLRLVLREAGSRDVGSVLIFNDDAEFHPNFQELFRRTELPQDWKVLYLGGVHKVEPEWAGVRVVRVKRIEGFSSIAVHRNAFMDLRRALRECLDGTTSLADALENFHAKQGSYACFPNLVWRVPLDAKAAHEQPFSGDGRQLAFPNAVSELLPRLISGGRVGEGVDRDTCGYDKTRPAMLGLLFLTRADVEHPQIWKEYVDEAPERVRVFSHPKFRDGTKFDFLNGTHISQHILTEWGDISLVMATRALLAEALACEELTHFALLSESCVPIIPLPLLLRRLDLDPRSQFKYRTRDNCLPLQWLRAWKAPGVPERCWRFSSQWWIMNRVAATISSIPDMTDLFREMVAPDEAYFATVLALQGYPLDGEVLNKASTWYFWPRGSGRPSEWSTLPKQRVMEMIHSGAPFARKFLKGSDIGELMLHRSPKQALSSRPLNEMDTVRS